MKKIFVLTGEPSGDKLASKVINELKKINPQIDYLSVGGENLKALGIKSIYDLKEITFLGFTRVILNLFSINNKINKTVKAILKYNPNLLFTVDSPDFTLRVAERVKKKNNQIKIIHYVAPQVWIWRKERLKKIKKFVDHTLLLFSFEKKYFNEENMDYTFVGHPLLQNTEKTKIDINQVIGKNKAIISIFPGSRKSEIIVLMPILLEFISLMNKKYTDMTYVFHSTKEYSSLIQSFIKETNLSNCEIISDDKVKSHILHKSIFAVAKSGTVSLEICNAKIPSIILYKMGLINFLIVKSLVNTKYANIVNFTADEEVIPELLQSDCNSKNIFKYVSSFLEDPNLMKKQLEKVNTTLTKLKTSGSPSEKASLTINRFL